MSPEVSWNCFCIKGIVSRDFLCMVFRLTAPPGPIRHFKEQFWFHTIIEELFDITGDSPVCSLPGGLRLPRVFTFGESQIILPRYSLPRSRDSPMYLTQGIIDSPVYSLSGSKKFDSPVYSLPGSQNFPVYLLPGGSRLLGASQGSQESPVYSPQGSRFTFWSCCKGFPRS